MISLFTALTFLLIADMTPEKRINRWYGFRSPKAKKNQNWDLAQKEMIAFAKRLVLPSFLIGLLFTAAEIFLIVRGAGNTVMALLLLECVVPAILYLILYFHCDRMLAD
ncbi:SdpI family protein [Enterococcus sp.]|uniref:SdpI family protein n=1 Tax=Enterococcus sp. TaxID=35783 RepID=UPI003C751AE7